MANAIFGGGCFWCTEAIFSQLKGVHNVESGYAGGHVANPTYEQICSKKTGHAEVVQVEFDESVISYADLCRIFLATHDPTTLNRQGYDEGPQYRSVIFTLDAQQAQIAREVIKEFETAKIYPKPIVTSVEPYVNYFPAEQYHQNYYRENSTQSYCTYVIEPKIAKLRKQFQAWLKE